MVSVLRGSAPQFDPAIVDFAALRRADQPGQIGATFGMDKIDQRQAFDRQAFRLKFGKGRVVAKDKATGIKKCQATGNACNDLSQAFFIGHDLTAI
ncbi:MAG: hypothetical protein BGN83_08980 [Rhizobium sp. 63-7]|nr:MAG: hypothetical protein BGN83_08980 [Rhizobium sp. 63-7]